MNTQIDSKPSAVLIESYNERLRKFLLPEDVQNATITVGESDSDGVATATITIPGKKTITTKIKRLNVDSTAPLTSVPELGGEKFMRLLMDDMDAVRVASSDIMNAIGIRTPDDIAKLPLEDQVTLEGAIMLSAAIWIKEGVFVPPTDIIVDDISNNYSEYLAKNGNVLGVFEVTAKPASLAYMGNTKGMLLSQASSTVPAVTDIEWTIVEINITSPEDMPRLTDPSQYVVSTKTGIIASDNPSIDIETFTGWISAANYTLKNGETVRVKITAEQIGEVFRLPIFTDVGISTVTGPTDVYYPFKLLFSREEPVDPFPYSLSVMVSKSYYTIYTGTELTGIVGQSSEIGFKYLPAVDEAHYVDYTYRDGTLTINLNGIQTKSYATDNATIMIPLITGAAAQELGGIDHFTSEYVTSATTTIPTPTWSIRENDYDVPLEDLPITVFNMTYEGEQKPKKFEIAMDIKLNHQWSLRDENGVELYSHLGESTGKGYLIDTSISKYEHKNISLDLTEHLVAGQNYTLHANLASLKIAVDPGTSVDPHVRVTELPQGITKLNLDLWYTKLTLPHLPKSLTDLTDLFSNCDRFNQDISDWDVSHVTNMDAMFSNATLFNQDLSKWCVTNITTKPYYFDTNSGLSAHHLPVWGTCPRSEDGSTPVEPVDPPPVVKFDLSTVTNGDEVGVWTLDINESELDSVTAQSATQSVLDTVNASSDIQITYDQLTAVKEETLITVTVNELGAELLEGTFIITLNIIANEVPQGITGLAADYPGTGWYKATDTGTVFCKDIVVNETYTFDEVTYTSVYTVDQARGLGSTAAVSNITNMSHMCGQDDSFNADVSSWDVSNVTDMSFMFSDASVFNQDISMWDVSNVTNMTYMFDGARKFNQNLSNWNVSKVTDISRMFANAVRFNGDISTWDTSSVTDMYSTFAGASVFNQDLSSWNVSSVVKMSNTFNYADVFNSDISGWDTSSVTDMSAMFANAPVFNQDISSWDTGKVTNLAYMFSSATAFNQDLSQWCVTNIAEEPTGFDGNSGLVAEQLPVWGTCPRGEDGSTPVEPVDPPPVVKFDLSTVTNGDEAGVWTLDVNEGDLSEVTAQSATQVVLDTFNTTSDIQITYDQLDAVKEDTLVTVTPNESGTGVLEGSFIITINVIAKIPEVVTPTQVNLSELTNVDQVGTWEYIAQSTKVNYTPDVIEVLILEIKNKYGVDVIADDFQATSTSAVNWNYTFTVTPTSTQSDSPLIGELVVIVKGATHSTTGTLILDHLHTAREYEGYWNIHTEHESSYETHPTELVQSVLDELNALYNTDITLDELDIDSLSDYGWVIISVKDPANTKVTGRLTIKPTYVPAGTLSDGVLDLSVLVSELMMGELEAVNPDDIDSVREAMEMIFESSNLYLGTEFTILDVSLDLKDRELTLTSASAKTTGVGVVTVIEKREPVDV